MEEEFVELDPSGRYARYDEILGRGASKTVFRGFDEYEGIEVAWNQVKLYDLMQTPGDLERLYCEIHLLKTLNHDNIIKFHTSWVDSANRNINFVTELFSSGTLRQYRLKHRRVNIRAVKHWCRQILRGLHYLHTHDPPVIHRDLKCDNIFINGNQGEVKIGDLGLAAVLRKSHAACCVGTPEFMAPEVYEEEYNELVDIYSFGMCILEMITFEYPYSECTHPAQIYKKVISGTKPESLYKVQNPAVRGFVEKCLASVSCRLTAMELLNDPFLQIDDCGSDLNLVHPLLRQPVYAIHDSIINGYSSDLTNEHGHNWDYDQVQCKLGEIDLFPCQEDESLTDADITIKGRRREDDGIFLRLRLADKEGRIRNIYFPFDIDKDTALSVATEMVAELDITDHDVTKIANMIDVEIATLVPEWKKALGIDESPHRRNVTLCHDCASNDSLVDYVSSNNVGAQNLQVIQCSNNGCAAIHGRFEEIMYKVDRSEQVKSGQANSNPYADIWAQRNAPEISLKGSGELYCSETHDAVDQPTIEGEKIINMDNASESYVRNSIRDTPSAAFAPIDDYENEIRRELRWLKAKYQLQLRELADQQLRVKSKPSISSPHPQDRNDAELSLSSVFTQLKMEDNGRILASYFPQKHYLSDFSLDSEKRSIDEVSQKVEDGEAGTGSYIPEQITMNAKSFYTGDLLPYSLNRATSLPVDAVDV